MLHRFYLNRPAPELGQDLGEDAPIMGPPAPDPVASGGGVDWLTSSISALTNIAKVGTSVYAARENTIASQRQADAAAAQARLTQQQNNLLMTGGKSSTLLPALLIGGGVLTLLAIYVLKKK